ncbi:protein PATRONUS 1-like isoform X2 [Cucurbita pepo subsp. pepo]|uniref:protein PATRONUS 1-like isoform X2 n=1 Tax=Cucurbita pepo subsp. pepo TaxID=3664 RepID=UPI000C9D7CB0|nr:protein PATRONUS 1-like isoform X2 [Cucurbita pepo subsp. pepo]
MNYVPISVGIITDYSPKWIFNWILCYLSPYNWSTCSIINSMAMTLQSGGLTQDENLNVRYNGSAVAGKANGMNSQRKSGLSGRKPLGDLSNSRKPDLNQSSKWKNTKNLTFIDEETGAGKKKNILKGSEKVQKGTRKVLSDISNSGMPNLPEASKKKQKLKLSTVREESLHHNAICEERFLHNHQDCIKSQNSAMDKDQFLSIVGLDLPKELMTSTRRKPDSPLKLMEMAELAVVDRSPKKLCLFGRGWPDSSPPCKSPKSRSVDTFSLWKDTDSINFTLIKTP